jgi:hypothetical protein
MPSTSKKQHNFMEAVAHSPKFAKKAGVPQSVGKDFAEADKGKTFRKGGSTNPKMQSINKQQTNHGSIQMPNVNLNKYMKMKDGGMAKSDMKMDMAQDKKMIKKAVGMHDKQMHGGKKTDMSTLKKGGMAKKMAAGGMPMVEKDGKKVPAFAADGVGKMAKGGMCSGGKAKKMAKGGGIEVKGKTRGKMC